MNKIFFTADLHFGHKNILKFLPNRPFASEDDTKAHDKWLSDLWLSSVDKRDTIYIIGDLTFYKSDEARRLLEKLPGRKYLIQGNHDNSIKAHANYFQTTAQILEVTLKPTILPLLKENMNLVLCHYPIIEWNNKYTGSIMLHGHCHGNLDEYNRHSEDLRFDVGIDSELAHRTGGFVDAETLYEAAMEKTNGMSFKEYAETIYNR